VGGDHVANCGFLWRERAFQLEFRASLVGVYRGKGGEAERVHNGKKEDVQLLEVIERCYVLRTGPLEKKEEVENGRQGQSPDDPYIFQSSAVWASRFEEASPLGDHDGDCEDER
jgi:hypothetical protein